MAAPAFCHAPPLAQPIGRRKHRAPQAPRCQQGARAQPPDRNPRPVTSKTPGAIAAATASIALLFARVTAPAPAHAVHVPTPVSHHASASVASVMAASSTAVVSVKPGLTSAAPSAAPTPPEADSNNEASASTTATPAQASSSAMVAASTPSSSASAASPSSSPSAASSQQSSALATQTAPPTLSPQAVAQSSAQAVAQSKPSLPPKFSDLSAAASLSARRRLALPSVPALPEVSLPELAEIAELELPAAASAVLGRLRMTRFARPAALSLVGFGAVTSTSVMVAQLSRRFGPGVSASGATLEERAALARGLLHNACTVVCVRIPFCVSDRTDLLAGLGRLVLTQRCNDAAGMAAACRAAADVLRSQSGLLEDSRRFAPHVDVFVADGLAEAERRFCGHVTMETMCADRLRRQAREDSDRDASGADYGIVTVVVATTEGVDLRCYEEDMTNMQRLRAALDAMAALEEGEAAGLEVVWVPGDNNEQALNRSEVADAFPCLQMT